MQLPFIKKLPLIKLFAALLALVLLVGCIKNDNPPPNATEENADVVYQWYRFMAKTQQLASPQPVILLQNRNFAYIGVGLYEAVQPGIDKAVSLSTKLYQMPTMPKPEPNKSYLWSAAANAALASMFKQFLPDLTGANKASIDSMENANNNRFKLSTADDVLSRSQAFGRAIATAIYNWSTTDNFNLSSTGYVLPVFPGSWVLTPPAFAAPVGPYLKDSRPFLTYSLTATAPPIPIPYSEGSSSEFYKAAKEVYDIGVNLTNEQKAIANWWADAGGAGVGVPAPYHILSIITNVLENQKAKLGKAAEVYGKTGIAFKDGPIITFRSKYQYNLIRPVSYIQRNISASWQSYLITPPYPEYTSGLVSFYGPIMQVLIREVGDVPVTDDAYAWRGLGARTYSSLTQLLAEAALSRVYAGLHYRFTQDVSVELGKALGNEIASIQLIKNK